MSAHAHISVVRLCVYACGAAPARFHPQRLAGKARRAYFGDVSLSGRARLLMCTPNEFFYNMQTSMRAIRNIRAGEARPGSAAASKGAPALMLPTQLPPLPGAPLPPPFSKSPFYFQRLCAAAVSLLLGRIGRWSGREIARCALSLARSAQAERDNESCYFMIKISSVRTPSSICYVPLKVGIFTDRSERFVYFRLSPRCVPAVRQGTLSKHEYGNGNAGRDGMCAKEFPKERNSVLSALMSPSGLTVQLRASADRSHRSAHRVMFVT
ncbi:hypothetical protein EVAR_36274_1 [Eumeta japonica]|uniref:Uncharacterized protein n=1 Tax=Eumeta variegata TaxID=151549 RepID=A0A4C1VIU9_EUMVA|nr:hypothetical protein EVAR_36274_1 [Eumeta japonica]